MDALLALSIAMMAGLLMTRLFNKARLPDVTAYLVAGVVIGPALLGALNIPYIGFHSYDEVHSLDLISKVALGFIAFSIGSEFKLSDLEKTGRQAAVIGVLQACVATLLVDVVLIAFALLSPGALSIPSAITLGAIAAATAPAATLMVVRQYKARGALTSLLLPIVALDDAVGLVLFAVSFGIAKALSAGAVDVVSIVVNPLLEIVGSLLLGAVSGWVLTKIEALYHSNRNRTAMSIGFVFLNVVLAETAFRLGPAELHFSSLLVCMMLGTVFCNLCPLADEIMERADKWSSPLMVMFFVLSGAELELGVFSQGSAIVIGLLYIVSRSLGKYFGARESARLVHCEDNVVKYLGITLLPQAGVALGMCVTAATLPNDGPMIRSIVLFAVLIYELFGPLATKWALTQAGDIRPKSAEVLNRRERKLAEAGKNK